MKELLKGLFENEEELKAFRDFELNICSSNYRETCFKNCNDCIVEKAKQAGIIRKSAFDELMEYVDNNIIGGVFHDSWDADDLKKLILAYKAEAEKKSKD